MAVTAIPREVRLVYPDSDGEPMAENTIQYHYIVTIHTGLAALFSEVPDVFVAADLFWYPVQGRPDICIAPDVMVAFGRPKGDRGSYKQWEENGVAPQVAFEILSPGNTATEMKKKRKFFDDYGVQEYYEYDPDSGTLDAWLRHGDFFRLTNITDEWTSPRLGVRFKLEETGELSVFRPDGRKFLDPVEEIARAEQAESRAEQAESRAEQAESRAERLAAKLRELGIDPNENYGRAENSDH
ncbi:MAG TPA: Uma2 family endonuclease [Blastocatellia bacterium]|nr:Uma2 family endonuclease [Blastocatellia bacterium]HMY75263.1 Uma2 family endonuclease [Blastocatellia bacterium]HMZ22209.1 Uma2 family endonuclease [Blastocatellia bacterium]